MLSRLGYTNSDMVALGLNGAESRAIQETLDKSAGAPFDDTLLRACGARGGQGCELGVEHEAAPTLNTLHSGSGHACDMPGYVPLVDQTRCNALFGADLAAQALYAWPTYDWDDMSEEVQAHWGAVGIDANVWEGGAVWSGWAAWSNRVFGTAGATRKAWGELDAGEQAAAQKLGFAASSWGRHWALDARLKDNVKALQWSELLESEQGNLTVLSWNESTWDADSMVGSKDCSALTLGIACRPEERDVSPNGVDMPGCHFDRAKGKVEYTIDTRSADTVDELDFGTPSIPSVPRFATFCASEKADVKAHVHAELQTGLENKIA